MSSEPASVPADADEVIAAFTSAAEVVRACSIRHGSTVRIDADAADDVFVSTDVHGRRNNFAAILKAAELDARPRRHLILQEVCHGGPTYADGGCMSHRMLEDVARLVAAYPQRVHFLLSNHELAEATDYPIMKSRRMLNVLFRMGLLNAYGTAGDRVRLAAVEFIRASPLAVRIGRHVFATHSLPERVDREPFDATVFDRDLRPSDVTDGGAAFRTVWGRDFRDENAAAFAKLVDARLLLHGHEPCPAGFRAPNEHQIILDCSSEPAYGAIVPTTGPVEQATVLQSLVRLA